MEHHRLRIHRQSWDAGASEGDVGRALGGVHADAEACGGVATGRDDDDTDDVRGDRQLRGDHGDVQRQAVRRLDRCADTGPVVVGRADEERGVAALACAERRVDARGHRDDDPLHGSGTDRQRPCGDRQVGRRDDRVVDGAIGAGHDLDVELEVDRAALRYGQIRLDDDGAHLCAQRPQRHVGHLDAVGDDRQLAGGHAAGHGRRHRHVDVHVDDVTGQDLDRRAAVAVGDVFEHALARRRPTVTGRQLAGVRDDGDPLASDDAADRERRSGLRNGRRVRAGGRHGGDTDDLGLAPRRRDSAEVDRGG